MSPVDDRGVKAMSRLILRGERVVATSRQHWISLTAPVGGAILGLVLTLVIAVQTPDTLGVLSDAAWWIWFALLAYAVLRLVSWHHDWFVATDQRLLLGYGLLHRKYDMMPLAKVTDLSFVRPPVGRIIGYGTFVLESAGQDQALHEITYLPHPEATYLAICEELFGSDSSQAQESSYDKSDDDPYDESGRYDEPGDAQPGAPARSRVLTRPRSRVADPREDFAADQVEGADGQLVDDTDLPLRPLGAYLDRDKPTEGRFRRRLLRSPSPPPSGVPQETQPRPDTGSGWSVSHEHAAQPQRVRRPGEDRPAW